MDIFSVFTLCGGLAFFLYGMSVMSSGLEKAAGGRLEQLLKKMTANPLKSLLLGAGITIAIQSSSAMTVMLVGLVNSGVMELGQTIGVIMGSNIGTTLTAWILALTGIESENVFVNLLKPENFSPVLALIGIILIMGSKKQRRRDIGRILVGFSILMMGMETMLYSLYDYPDLFKKLMDRLSDEVNEYFDYLEREQLLLPTVGFQRLAQGTYCATTRLPGYDESEKRPLKTTDVWGFMDSQETVGISAEMFEEFEVVNSMIGYP